MPLRAGCSAFPASRCKRRAVLKNTTLMGVRRNQQTRKSSASCALEETAAAKTQSCSRRTSLGSPRAAQEVGRPR